jgi:hypothetical protein
MYYAQNFIDIDPLNTVHQLYLMVGSLIHSAYGVTAVHQTRLLQ